MPFVFPVGFLPDGCIFSLCFFSMTLEPVWSRCSCWWCLPDAKILHGCCAFLDWVDRCLLIPNFIWNGTHRSSSVKHHQDLQLGLLLPHPLVLVLRRRPDGPLVCQSTYTQRPCSQPCCGEAMALSSCHTHRQVLTWLEASVVVVWCWVPAPSASPVMGSFHGGCCCCLRCENSHENLVVICFYIFVLLSLCKGLSLFSICCIGLYAIVPASSE